MATPNRSPSRRKSDDRTPVNPLTASIPASAVEGAGRAGAATGKEKLPRNLLGLFIFLPFISLAPNLGNNISAYFSALQVQELAGNADKVAVLSMISAVSAVGAMIAQPLVGVLSDRARTRVGRRRPWILITGLAGAVGLITAGLSTSIAMLTVGVTIVLFSFGAMQSPLTAILPDRVAPRFRGRYSTLAGLGTLLGGIGGSIYGSVFKDSIPAGYFSIAGVLLLIVVLFVVFVKDRDNRGDPREPFAVTAFLKAYWVNPIKYPDFFFGFLGRILLFGSYGLVNTYMIYIAQDYVGLSRDSAATLVPLVSAAALPTILISTVIAGPLSDRIGRRKPLVLIAGLLIVLGSVVPIVSATVAGLFVSSVIIGLGFGTFISVDQALMSSILPDAERYGTDLGVLNIASSLPYAVGPLFAGLVLGIFHSYLALYIAVAVVALIGALAVLGIKKVR